MNFIYNETGGRELGRNEEDMEGQRMKQMLERIGGLCFVLAFAVFAFGSGRTASAAVVDVTVGTEITSVSVTVGDTGKLQPQPGELRNEWGQLVTVMKYSYSSMDSKVIKVDGEGNYQALSYGSTCVTVRGFSETGEVLYSGTCWFMVGIDMTNVTLAADHLEGALAYHWAYMGSIAVNSEIVLGEDNSVVTCSSENPEMEVECHLNQNELQFVTSDVGTTRLFVTINGKTFEVTLVVTRFEISKSSYVAAKGKTTKLRVKGARQPVAWTSSDSKVVKVSSDGSIRCRKIGNAVITASSGGLKVGCAVSVISPKQYKVIKRAKKIGANWKYSQPKRMKNGYYDCSSLVWKSYKLMGKTFGMSHYAPVAADVAKWCASHGKRIAKSYTRTHIQKMKLRPGDLMFETGKNNGRYKGIYHVEMFIGYAVSEYDTNGAPVLNELWAARPEGYYGGGHLIMRP